MSLRLGRGKDVSIRSRDEFLVLAVLVGWWNCGTHARLCCDRGLPSLAVRIEATGALLPLPMLVFGNPLTRTGGGHDYEQTKRGVQDDRTDWTDRTLTAGLNEH